MHPVTFGPLCCMIDGSRHSYESTAAWLCVPQHSSSQQEARLSPPHYDSFAASPPLFPTQLFSFIFPFFFFPPQNAKQLTRRSVRGLRALAPTCTCLLPLQNVAGFISTHSVLAGVSLCLYGRRVQPSGVIHADRLFLNGRHLCTTCVCVRACGKTVCDVCVLVIS